MNQRKEVTIGIGGAAGDGLDKTGDTLAKTCSRLGLYLCAYNSYQSVIRGGHIWLRVRASEQKVYTHGDHLNVLIALNQDSIERHAREVNEGGAIIYNSDKLKIAPGLAGDNVLPAPMPVAELLKPLGNSPRSCRKPLPWARWSSCSTWNSTWRRKCSPTRSNTRGRTWSTRTSTSCAPDTSTPERNLSRWATNGTSRACGVRS